MEFVDLRALDKSLKVIVDKFKILGEAAFPATKLATTKAAAYIERTLIDYASGVQIPGVDKTVNNVEYRNGVTRQKLGDFDWIIYNSNENAADKVEDGTPRIDLKQYLPFPKSRTSKDGIPYSHIPFRYKAAEIKKLGKETAGGVLGMAKSYVTGSYIDDRGVKRFTYKWAQREKQLDKRLKGTKYQGMVRMETSTGRKSSSAYMTFRTISLKSPADSWIIPARAGVPLTKLAEQNTRAEVNRIIKQGIDQDLKLM